LVTVNVSCYLLSFSVFRAFLLIHACCVEWDVKLHSPTLVLFHSLLLSSTLVVQMEQPVGCMCICTFSEKIS